MVWFQCEDCGENLKKPKLPGHFRMCSAYKLSCIDCGETFTQQSVQGHTQCISEAEKYGPKDQAKSSRDANTKVNKPKPAVDIDVNVGLSTHPPWFCSLCNTTTTSKQTLLLHADGKKHRAKAKAYHAAQKQENKPDISDQKPVGTNDVSTMNLDETDTKDQDNKHDMESDMPATAAVKEDSLKKRKFETSKLGEAEIQGDTNDGEVIQTNEGEEKNKKKMKKDADHNGANDEAEEFSDHKIRWKKLITSTLKSNSDGVLKIKKLQKLVLKALQGSGVPEGKDQLKKKMMDKINSSSRFIVDGKHIHLAKKIKST